MSRHSGTVRRGLFEARKKATKRGKKASYTPWKIGKRGDKFVVTNLPDKTPRSKAERFHWELGTVEAAEKTYNAAKKRGAGDKRLSELAMGVEIAHARASDTAPTTALQRKHRYEHEDWQDVMEKHNRAVRAAEEARREAARAEHAARVQSMDLAGDVISRMQSKMPGMQRDMFNKQTAVNWSHSSGAYVSASLQGATTEDPMAMLMVVLQGDKDVTVNRKLRGFKHRQDKDALGTRQTYTLTSMSVPADRFVAWATSELKKVHTVLSTLSESARGRLGVAVYRLEEAVRGSSLDEARAGRPPKRLLNAAVKAMRLYLGSVDKIRPRAEERLYNNAMKAVSKVAKAIGAPYAAVWEQIEDRARMLGALLPQPGKDI